MSENRFRIIILVCLSISSASGFLHSLGNAIRVSNSKLELMAEMRNRIDSLNDKINNFDRIMAKLNDAKPLIELLQKLTNSKSLSIRIADIISRLVTVCPPNTASLRIGSKCYEHNTKVWSDYNSAIVYCESRGGYLARPNVTDSNYLANLRKVFPSIGEESVLVGITDINREGFFEFADGTPVPPSRFLGGSYPVNDDQDCVSLLSNGGFSLTDTTCVLLHQVLCEFDPVNLLPGEFYSFI